MNTTEARTERPARFATQMACWIGRGDEAVRGVVLNVSHAGMYVQASAGLGDVPELDVSLLPEPEQRQVDVTTRVVWRAPTASSARGRGQGMGLEVRQPPATYAAIVYLAAGVIPVACRHCGLEVGVGLADPEEPQHPFAYYAPPGATRVCDHRQPFLSPGAPSEKMAETCPELGKAVLAALTDGTLKRR